MIIRAMTPDDIQPLREIHQRYFKNDFPFPDFTEHFLNAFVVLENDEIITAGGVKTILESVVISNKDMSPVIRRDALQRLLLASMFTAGSFGYDQIHAFVTDDKWRRRLIKSGFQPTAGQSLFIGV